MVRVDTPGPIQYVFAFKVVIQFEEIDLLLVVCNPLARKIDSSADLVRPLIGVEFAVPAGAKNLSKTDSKSLVSVSSVR